jgi:hypothetical protein
MVRDVFIDVIVLMEQHVMLEQEYVFVEWVQLENYVIKVCVIDEKFFLFCKK